MCPATKVEEVVQQKMDGWLNISNPKWVQYSMLQVNFLVNIRNIIILGILIHNLLNMK